MRKILAATVEYQEDDGIIRIERFTELDDLFNYLLEFGYDEIKVTKCYSLGKRVMDRLKNE